ncbi:hypothetical protein C8Q78DRAFT_1080240 [Trametes maxima]|nr:hypothetical protein C8Q78DRAFT_1080240 [Trametes maxima]
MGHATIHNAPENSQDHFGTLLPTVQLCGGGFLWLSGACLPQDYKTIKSQRVSWTVLIMYLLCRYVTAISAVLEMIYVCTYPRPISASVGKAAIGLRRFSMLSGFGIMLLRVNSLWNHTLVSVLTSTSLVAFLGVIALQVSDLDILYMGHTQTPFVSVRFLRRAIGFVGCLVAVHTSCREYEKLAEDNVTISIPTLTWDWRVVLRRLLDVATLGIGDARGLARTSHRSQDVACTNTRAAGVFELKALPSDALIHKSSTQGLKNTYGAQQAPSDEGSSSAFSSPVSILPPETHSFVPNPGRAGSDTG